MTNQAVFIQGSTMRHVLVMTSASAMGLLTMFGVDMVDMYFLTLLGEQELAAAVGYAGTLTFFLVAVSIGMLISLGALVARAEGAGQRDRARRYCSSGLLFNFIVSVVISFFGWLYLRELLMLLGASGKTLEYAIRYGSIILPNMPILVLGMSAAAGVRAVGDARRSMWATVIGSLVNGILDPVFIFTFEWGLEGAAIASVVARLVVFGIAWHAIAYVHKLPRWITRDEFLADLRPILTIATPAILTNLATPIGGSFVLRTMSQFGDSAVAGAAIMGRISPVAFAAIFALSSAVGPIIGQNAGAGLYDRVRSTLRNAMLFNVVYVLLAWVLLSACADLIVTVFSASGTSADLLRFYYQFLTGTFMFHGALFVANATFNNLHHPHWATAFNFARVLLGTIPAVYFGGLWYGSRGVIAGEAFGSVLFGLLAVVAAFYLINRLASEQVVLPHPEPALRRGLEEVREPPV